MYCLVYYERNKMNETDNQWLMEKLINGSEHTEKWFRVNWKDFIKDIPWDLSEALKSDVIDGYISDWYKDNHNDIMKKYIEENGDKLKLHIREVFWWDEKLWYIVERFVSWEPKSIWVSDTWFLYENRWWREYWNIENDESYEKIYNEWIKLFEHNSGEIQALLPSYKKLELECQK